MRKIWIFLVLFSLPLTTFAGVDFFALLPNPAGDDELGEYIEIRNTGCQIVDIGGYHLYDAANKTYIIPSGTTIGSHENISFPYQTTHIALNNSSNESITLTDASGTILDSESYSTTQKDDIVISLNPVDESCYVIPPVESNTGTTSTGSFVSQDDGTTATGETNTGTMDTGSGASDNSEGQDTGGTSTGTETETVQENTNTGTSQDTNSQTIEHSNSGILFPEIFPTRQEPTNAAFSGNIWDCGINQLCRVNVTFDPIFTEGLVAKDYLCEVITATGTLTTCNPNTLYYSTDSSFSLRLTSKIDPSQSKSMSWEVRFMVVPSERSIGVTNTGTTDSGTINTSVTSSGIIFPEIISTFQNYTNTTNSGDTLTCVTSPCRVNFTLDPIFTGSFLSRDYTCEIHYGTGVYDSCNPPQLYPIGTGSIEVTVIHKASGQKETKTIEIVQNITTAPIVSKAPMNNDPINTVKDTTKPVAIIDFDGKLKPYYEQMNDYEFNCYVMTCSVNLTAERSYDPDGGSTRYLWIYGQNEIKTTKDPGTQKYTIGDHVIIFRVIDTAGNYDEIRYIIHVLGPRAEEVKIKTKKVKDPSLRGTKQSNKIKVKKKKLKKMDFFDPPMIMLQKSKFTETDYHYLCRTTTRDCSLNLTLSGAEIGIYYTWTYDDGEVISSKNPRSKKLSIGSHEITIAATYSGSTDILWKQTISAQVEKITKPKKPKKIKAKKAPKTEIKKETKSTIIPISDTEQVQTDYIPYTTMALFGGILPLVFLRRFLTGLI